MLVQFLEGSSLSLSNHWLGVTVTLSWIFFFSPGAKSACLYREFVLRTNRADECATKRVLLYRCKENSPFLDVQSVNSPNNQLAQSTLNLTTFTS